MKNIILLLTMMTLFFSVAPEAEAGLLSGLLGNRSRNNQSRNHNRVDVNVALALALSGVPVNNLNRIQANRLLRQANNDFAFNARVANQALANQVALQQLALQQAQLNAFVPVVPIPQAVFVPLGFNGLGATGYGASGLNSPYAAVPVNSLALPATTFFNAPVRLRVNTISIRGCRR